MAKVLVISAGFAGHTAALYLGDKLGRKHEITVMSNARCIWLCPLLGLGGRGTYEAASRPSSNSSPYMTVSTSSSSMPPQRRFTPTRATSTCWAEEIGTGKEVRVDYDYLVIAPGPLSEFCRHARTRT